LPGHKVRRLQKGLLMEVRGFFASLFDYSFSSYIAPKIIKVLYVIMTVLVALFTLLFVLYAFRVSTGFGVVALLIGGPIYFLLSMIWGRVLLEVLSAFFRIQGDVYEINRRGAGEAIALAMQPMPSLITAEPEPAPILAAEFCGSCGTERQNGKAFCTSCGSAFA
jgi:uncharacterized protein DUF4282